MLLGPHSEAKSEADFRFHDINLDINWGGQSPYGMDSRGMTWGISGTRQTYVDTAGRGIRQLKIAGSSVQV
jgi:hypothetical protein